MNLDHLHRDLGRVEGEVLALRRDVNDINTKLDAVLRRQYKFAGGAAVVSAIGSFLVAWFLK
jgi:hypothetical protein